MSRGLVIAAPASGSGKTTLTLALLRALRTRGTAVASLKIGPDYIDPAFHRAASGAPCPNLDPWAMRAATVARIAAEAAAHAEIVIAEGVMGLFDGAADGSGSTADAAALLGWPVVVVIDASGMAATAAAVVQGLARFRDDVEVAGVIFNRVGGARHGELLARACAPLGIPVLGALARDDALALPDRHLGLVQAGEHPALESFIERAAAVVGARVDLDRLAALARACPAGVPAAREPMAAPGRHIAVARDVAFAFCYELTLDDWRAAGAEVSFFSPLADEAPPAAADAVYLPGGYPELHAARLAANRGFLDGLRAAAARGAFVYGECGGYMVLGDTLTDADGRRHSMAGLLPLATSFAERRLHLGYREATLAADCALGAAGAAFRAHEFHFATVVTEPDDAPLFACRDSAGADVGAAGCRRGNVAGSFVHLIDRC